MKMAPGTHTREVVEHKDTWKEGAMLTRGQEIAVEVNEADAVDVVLKPGEMSLHHHKIFHASHANTSNDRRIGLAIRYIPTHVRQIAISDDSAALVRGVDTFKHFIEERRPTSDRDPIGAEMQSKAGRCSAMHPLRWHGSQGVPEGSVAARSKRSGHGIRLMADPAGRSLSKVRTLRCSRHSSPCPANFQHGC